MKKNKSLVLIILFLFIFIGISSIIIGKMQNTVTLTQLAGQSSRQMMGYLLRTKNGKLIVIDGGTKEDAIQLLEQIQENGGKVDAWFLTHAHDDHVGAFTQIINTTNTIEIGNIYVSTNDLTWYEEQEPLRAEFTKEFLQTLDRKDLKEKVIQPSLNQKIEIDGIQVEILGIKNPEITENAGNEQSMVIKFKVGNKSILILGDTGIKSSEKLIKTQRKKLKSDIVQMAHHGQAGATKQLYQMIQPTICLWPTPEWLWNNDVGKGKGMGPWKTLETRTWMEELKVKKNYVAKDGNCEIEIK